MPTVTSGKVLVTGANGFVAAWIVKELLDRGYAVRGTVRSEAKAAPLRSFFGTYGDKFETAIVEDITKDGAFDEAVKGVDAVMHTASPVVFTEGDPAIVIEPAVRGTTSILTSARKASSIRRVVITSSTAAILTFQDAPRIFSEEDWNEAVLEAVRTQGIAANSTEKYCASKVLAERAAWDVWRGWKDGGDVEWDLVAINPPWVYGPPLLPGTKLEQFSESVIEWHRTIVLGGQSQIPRGSSYVDVRDLAIAHVLAIIKPDAAGERIIASARGFTWDEWVTASRQHFPELPVRSEDRDPQTPTVYHVAYVPDKEQRLLGVKFRTIEETAKDTLDEFKARGWLP